MTAWKLSGFLACLLATLMTAGGHWFVLQSVAWTRMFVEFSRQDSVSLALIKTFDGQHPCAMCLQIHKNQQQEKQQNSKSPGVKAYKMPEFYLAERLIAVPIAPIVEDESTRYISSCHADFIDSPPSPPPRQFKG